MALSTLLLQKPHIRSKSCKNIKVLNVVCISGVRVILILCLLKATRSSNPHNILIRPPADSSRIFAHLVFQGKIKAAMWFLTELSWGSFLPLPTPVGESTVFNELVKKHPDPSPVTPMSLINPDTTILQSCHPVIFDFLDSDLICCTVVRIEGSVDLQGLMHWELRHLYTSFWTASSDLSFFDLNCKTYFHIILRSRCFAPFY